MRRPLTLGSLFDGIGGFPLAGKLAGMRPVWASEIEPFPIRVTEKRLPGMKHYGNIFSLRGAGLEPVDVVTFGSPCQDLSIAGKREGLGGGRSSLFFEAVRIIREMREATDGKYPRWAVWENVPGALSSHDGEDFRQVLESLIRIKDPGADVPLPAAGRWLPVGEIMGDGHSSPGASSTPRRVGASHKDGNVYLLSSILMEDVPDRYSLSPKACQGILRRAAKRGKELPEVLKAALEQQARDAPGSAQGRATGAGATDMERKARRRSAAGNRPASSEKITPRPAAPPFREDGVCQTLCARMGTGREQHPPDPEDPFGLRGRGQGRAGPERPVGDAGLPTTTRRCSRQKPLA